MTLVIVKPSGIEEIKVDDEQSILITDIKIIFTRNKELTEIKLQRNCKILIKP